MPVISSGGWDGVTDLVAYLKQVDGLTKTMQMRVARGVAVVYRGKAPGAIGKAVRGRSRTVGPVRTASVTIRRVYMGPLGGAVNGRDVGAQALSHWTNDGTTGPIKRTNGEPFYLWGRVIPSVRGQRAQGWVQAARSEGDVIADAAFAQLATQTDTTLRRFGR